MTSLLPPRLTRRQILGSAAALAGGLMTGACASKERPRTVPASTTDSTTLASIAPPPTVGLVGDSISFISRGALEPALRAQGFGRIEFDALPGRRIVEGENSGV